MTPAQARIARANTLDAERLAARELAELRTRRDEPNPILDAAQALAGLLRAAAEADLPMPYTVNVEEYQPVGHPRHDYGRVGGISLQVDTLADLVEWARWLDSTIDDTAEPYAGQVHCHAYGYAGPVPVRVTALVAAEPTLAEVTA